MKSMNASQGSLEITAGPVMLAIFCPFSSSSNTVAADGPVTDQTTGYSNIFSWNGIHLYI